MEIGILGGDFSGLTTVPRVNGKEQLAKDFRNLAPIDFVDDKDVLFQIFLLCQFLSHSALLRLDGFIYHKFVGIRLGSKGFTEEGGNVLYHCEFHISFQHLAHFIHIQRELVDQCIPWDGDINMLVIHTGKPL